MPHFIILYHINPNPQSRYLDTRAKTFLRRSRLFLSKLKLGVKQSHLHQIHEFRRSPFSLFYPLVFANEDFRHHKTVLFWVPSFVRHARIMEIFIAALAHSGAFGVEKSSHSKSRTNLDSRYSVSQNGKLPRKTAWLWEMRLIIWNG